MVIFHYGTLYENSSDPVSQDHFFGQNNRVEIWLASTIIEVRQVNSVNSCVTFVTKYSAIIGVWHNLSLKESSRFIVIRN